MKAVLKKLICAAAILQCGGVYGYAAIGDTCDKRGYAVAYVNGAGTSWSEAYSELLALKAGMGLGERKNNELISYDLYYNRTAADAEIALFEDLTAEWIAREKKFEKLTKQHWEIFWDFVAHGGRNEGDWLSLRQVITEAVPEFGAFYASFVNEYRAKIIASLLKLVANPPKKRDAMGHAARIKSLALEGKKIMVVAHSQGNQYTKLIKDAALSINGFGLENISFLHIAPPAEPVFGPYILGNRDQVVEGMRERNPDKAVPAANFEIPEEHVRSKDLMGHSLISTYLDAGIGARAEVAQLAKQQISRLTTPTTDGNPGLFTVTMIWDRTGDIDLHTFEPTGAHVYYYKKEGKHGFLDVDNRHGFGPEHYYASCEDSKIGVGTYRIGVNNYAADAKSEVTVQVSSAFEGVIYSKERFVIGPQKGTEGNSSPIPVVEVEVKKDAFDQYEVVVR